MAVACIVPCCTDTELFACFMLSCVSCFGSSDRASQPFPFCVHTDGVLQPLSEWVVTNAQTLWAVKPCTSLCRPLEMTNTSASLQLSLPRMMPERRLAAAAPGSATQEDCQKVGKGLIRLPAVNPRTPAPKSVGFQQFCDGLRTDLPGDSLGRGSFDTSTRFVGGDPGAKFGATAPLEYETTGDVGHPHWEAIFEYILRQCGYLLEFDTVYVMVDNRNLAEHKRQDPSLPHWPAAARWWHSRLKLIGPHKEKTELLLFPISATTGLHHVHPTWAGTLRLQIFGQRPFWPGSLLIQMVDSLRCTHCLLSDASAQTLRLSTHSIVSAVREWDRVHLWSA